MKMKIHLFYCFLTDESSAFYEKQMLRFPESIREIINLYKDKNDRYLRIVSKLLIEKAVSRIFHDEKKILIKLKKTSYNKSYLENLNLNFSISHSEKLCVVAVSEKAGIGIDAEFIKPIDVKLFTDFLHLLEIEFLNKSKNPEIEFLKVWTKKEAVLKATGKAIFDELHQIDAHLNKIHFASEVFYTKEISFSEKYVVNLAINYEDFDLILEEITF